MDKVFIKKFKKLNDYDNYVINDNSICTFNNRVLLPSGYFVGGYSSYNTYIVNNNSNLVGSIYSSNGDYRCAFDKNRIEVKSRIFRDDFIKENNEVVEKRNLNKENLLRNISIDIESGKGLIYLSQALNRIVCGNYDFIGKRMELIRPFELEKTMVDTLETIGIDEARFLGFSAVRDTYIEYIKMEKESKNKNSKILIKS